MKLRVVQSQWEPFINGLRERRNVAVDMTQEKMRGTAGRAGAIAGGMERVRTMFTTNRN